MVVIEPYCQISLKGPRNLSPKAVFIRKKNFSKAKYFSTNRKYFDFWVVRYIETLQNNQNYLFIYRGLQNEYFFRL